MRSRSGSHLFAKPFHLNWEKLGCLDEILADTSRVLLVAQREGEMDRSLLLVDGGTEKIIEIPARGIKGLNRMSLAGVKWVTVDREAEEWLRSRASERRLRKGFTIS